MNPEEKFELKNTFETDLMIQKIDEFEESIKQMDKIKKEYDDLKGEIKKTLLKIGKQNHLEQVKFTTPKGIQITLSIGKPAEFEERISTEFDLDYLKENYKNIYEECLKEKKHNVCVFNGSNDTLKITLPK